MYFFSSFVSSLFLSFSIQLVRSVRYVGRSFFSQFVSSSVSCCLFVCLVCSLCSSCVSLVV